MGNRALAQAGLLHKRTLALQPNRALQAIKAVHTLAWFSIESCMVYVLYAGFARQSDRRVAIAAGVVATESLIFVASGFRCPLTPGARRCPERFSHGHLSAEVAGAQPSGHPCATDRPSWFPAHSEHPLREARRRLERQRDEDPDDDDGAAGALVPAA